MLVFSTLSVGATAHRASTPGPSSPVPTFSAVAAEPAIAPGALASAWADYDGDGDLDLVMTFLNGEVRLYRNDGTRFVNVGPQLGLPVAGEPIAGASWGDYDGDGDVDLYLGSMAEPVTSRNYLYRNEGGRRFTEVALEVGAAAQGVSSRQSSWIDYDNDGDADLFIANRVGYNVLLRNDGGRFVDVSREANLRDVRRTVGACWFDFDQDGDLDVFLANQEGDKDALYRNDGGRFTDVAPELGMDQAQRRLADGGVGCAVGDYDNDGDLDLFVAAYGNSLLYRNEPGGRFVEVALGSGVAVQGYSVGATWQDVDHDGLLDLYVTGYLRNGKVRTPNARLLRNSGGRFSDALPPNHPLRAADHGTQWADFDGDGDLDASVTDSRRDAGAVPVLRNELPKGLRERSIQVSVRGRRGHPCCAGAEVRLYGEDNRLIGTRLVSTGDGYNSQSVLPVHFGLATSGRVSVAVTFLTARGREEQRVENVDPASLRGKPLIVRQER